MNKPYLLFGNHNSPYWYGKMKNKLNIIIILFLLSSKINAYEIQDFSDSEWFDNLTVEYIINNQTPVLSEYDIISFKFPKKNNSSDYKDWGYYSITGIGGVGAIYSVSKIDDNKFIFEYGYYPSSADQKEKPVKESNPNTCTVYVQNENTLVLINSPLGMYRKTLYRKSYTKNSSIIMEEGIVNDLNVRIRLEPSTTKGLIVGKLQTGAHVKIIKKSELSDADGIKNYWYQIQVEGYPICWIFGEYVTKQEDFLKNFGVVE